MYAHIFKRVLDVIISLLMLILLSPVWLITMLLLAIKNNVNGIFFIQLRPGKNGKLFKLFKFKTMTDKFDAEGKMLPDEKRITKIGKYIRSTSIDELPQLINILKGDMSLIGPRPLLAEYLPLYSEKQRQRHKVRPGISGWAQVNGRNAISWEQKFEYDVWYVNHISFSLDLKIAILTIMKVISKEGISSANCETMEYFKGNV